MSNHLIQISSIIISPLLGSILAVIFNKRHTQWAAGISIFSTIIVMILALNLLVNTPTVASSLSFNWFNLGLHSITIGFLINTQTLLMLGLVPFIALLVQLYSLSYMQNDPDQYRYYAFLSLFLFAMLGIVLSDNLLMLYIFWELVGLCSYLLIGFWYKKTSATQAAKKAFILNRIGDAGLLAGIFLTYQQIGTFQFSIIEGSVIQLSTLSSLLLFCGCVAKSAQFPLHFWLPDAMEGPTPASALIHAATMVAAGIFLMARVFPVLSPNALTVMAIIGATTMLLGAIYAVFQTDIKKVLAYSTISQLGLMVVALGVGAQHAAIFHLLTHAFFKAGLFLAAGSVIHGLHHVHSHHPQDMRCMGGLRKQMPITFIGYIVCALALAGIPLFSGFLSKDMILASVWHWANTHGSWHYLLAVSVFFSAGLTALYMTKQIILVFMGEWRDKKINVTDIHESSYIMTIPIILLAIGSLGIVFSLNPLSPHHSWFWQFMQYTIEPESSHTIAILSTILALTGILIAIKISPKMPHFESIDEIIEFLINRKQTFINKINYQLHLFTHNQWIGGNFYDNQLFYGLVSIGKKLHYFDKKIIDALVNLVGNTPPQLAQLIAWTDRSIIDGMVNSIATFAKRIGSSTRQLQTGRIQWYLIAMAIALIMLIMTNQ
jgi:NADH-quinone oxidoreductase subunit L